MSLMFLKLGDPCFDDGFFPNEKNSKNFFPPGWHSLHRTSFLILSSLSHSEQEKISKLNQVNYEEAKSRDVGKARGGMKWFWTQA